MQEYNAREKKSEKITGQQRSVLFGLQLKQSYFALSIGTCLLTLENSIM